MDLKEYSKNEGLGQNHPWELARFNVVYDIIRKHLPARKKIIYDIGCGDIFFIQSLHKKLPEDNFIAIDTAFNDELIDELKKRRDSTNILFYNNITQAESAHIKADLVFLMDVIEHIEKDQNFITELMNSTIIKNETMLMITVPALQSLYCTHDYWLGHYRRYTLKELKERFNAFQIDILDEGYFFKSLVVPRFIERKIKKHNTDNFNKGTDVSNWRGGRLITSLYKNILWLDYLFLNKLLHWKRLGGLSCYLFVKIKK